MPFNPLETGRRTLQQQESNANELTKYRRDYDIAVNTQKSSEAELSNLLIQQENEQSAALKAAEENAAVLQADADRLAAEQAASDAKFYAGMENINSRDTLENFLAALGVNPYSGDQGWAFSTKIAQARGSNYFVNRPGSNMMFEMGLVYTATPTPELSAKWSAAYSKQYPSVSEFDAKRGQYAISKYGSMLAPMSSYVTPAWMPYSASAGPNTGESRATIIASMPGGSILDPTFKGTPGTTTVNGVTSVTVKAEASDNVTYKDLLAQSIVEAQKNADAGYSVFWTKPENTEAGRMAAAMINTGGAPSTWSRSTGLVNTPINQLPSWASTTNPEQMAVQAELQAAIKAEVAKANATPIPTNYSVGERNPYAYGSAAWWSQEIVNRETVAKYNTAENVQRGVVEQLTNAALSRQTVFENVKEKQTLQTPTVPVISRNDDNQAAREVWNTRYAGTGWEPVTQSLVDRRMAENPNNFAPGYAGDADTQARSKKYLALGLDPITAVTRALNDQMMAARSATDKSVRGTAPELYYENELRKVAEYSNARADVASYEMAKSWVPYMGNPYESQAITLIKMVEGDQRVLPGMLDTVNPKINGIEVSLSELQWQTAKGKLLPEVSFEKPIMLAGMRAGQIYEGIAYPNELTNYARVAGATYKEGMTYQNVDMSYTVMPTALSRNPTAYSLNEKGEPSIFTPVTKAPESENNSGLLPIQPITQLQPTYFEDVQNAFKNTPLLGFFYEKGTKGEAPGWFISAAEFGKNYLSKSSIGEAGRIFALNVGEIPKSEGIVQKTYEDYINRGLIVNNATTNQPEFTGNLQEYTLLSNQIRQVETYKKEMQPKAASITGNTDVNNLKTKPYGDWLMGVGEGYYKRVTEPYQNYTKNTGVLGSTATAIVDIPNMVVAGAGMSIMGGEILLHNPSAFPGLAMAGLAMQAKGIYDKPIESTAQIVTTAALFSAAGEANVVKKATAFTGDNVVNPWYSRGMKISEGSPIIRNIVSEGVPGVTKGISRTVPESTKFTYVGGKIPFTESEIFLGYARGTSGTKPQIFTSRTAVNKILVETEPKMPSGFDIRNPFKWSPGDKQIIQPFLEKTAHPEHLKLMKLGFEMEDLLGLSSKQLTDLYETYQPIGTATQAGVSAETTQSIYSILARGGKGTIQVGSRGLADLIGTRFLRDLSGSDIDLTMARANMPDAYVGLNALFRESNRENVVWYDSTKRFVQKLPKEEWIDYRLVSEKLNPGMKEHLIGAQPAELHADVMGMARKTTMGEDMFIATPEYAIRSKLSRWFGGYKYNPKTGYSEVITGGSKPITDIADIYVTERYIAKTAYQNEMFDLGKRYELASKTIYDYGENLGIKNGKSIGKTLENAEDILEGVNRNPNAITRNGEIWTEIDRNYAGLDLTNPKVKAAIKRMFGEKYLKEKMAGAAVLSGSKKPLLDISLEKLQSAKKSGSLIELPSGAKISPWSFEDVLNPDYTINMKAAQEHGIARDRIFGYVIKVFVGKEGEGVVNIPGKETVGMDVLHTHIVDKVGEKFISDVLSPGDIAGTLYGSGGPDPWMNQNFKMGALIEGKLPGQKIGVIENIVRKKSLTQTQAIEWAREFNRRYAGDEGGAESFDFDRYTEDQQYRSLVDNSANAKSGERLSNFMMGELTKAELKQLPKGTSIEKAREIALSKFSSPDFDFNSYVENSSMYKIMSNRDQANTIRQVQSQMGKEPIAPYEIQRMSFISDKNGIHIFEDRRMGMVSESEFGAQKRSLQPPQYNVAGIFSDDIMRGIKPSITPVKFSDTFVLGKNLELMGNVFENSGWGGGMRQNEITRRFASKSNKKGIIIDDIMADGSFDKYMNEWADIEDKSSLIGKSAGYYPGVKSSKSIQLKYPLLSAKIQNYPIKTIQQKRNRYPENIITPTEMTYAISNYSEEEYPTQLITTNIGSYPELIKIPDYPNITTEYPTTKVPPNYPPVYPPTKTPPEYPTIYPPTKYPPTKVPPDYPTWVFISTEKGIPRIKLDMNKKRKPKRKKKSRVAMDWFINNPVPLFQTVFGTRLGVSWDQWRPRELKLPKTFKKTKKN